MSSSAKSGPASRSESSSIRSVRSLASRPESPPGPNCPSAVSSSTWSSASITPSTASAWTRSIRPARKALRVNSPGRAGRTCSASGQTVFRAAVGAPVATPPRGFRPKGFPGVAATGGPEVEIDGKLPVRVVWSSRCSSCRGGDGPGFECRVRAIRRGRGSEERFQRRCVPGPRCGRLLGGTPGGEAIAAMVSSVGGSMPGAPIGRGSRAGGF
ncbi:MAG: hypothetical protein Ct9H300mP1_38830 [Planctomycetaceae bacterium]|nr:MAG: hypothetical protein Ct9H300mP1_38830 [Planctomycetaceae bacterium]